jgi:hypothetical protein
VIVSFVKRRQNQRSKLHKAKHQDIKLNLTHYGCPIKSICRMLHQLHIGMWEISCDLSPVMFLNLTHYG